MHCMYISPCRCHESTEAVVLRGRHGEIQGKGYRMCMPHERVVDPQIFCTRNEDRTAAKPKSQAELFGRDFKIST